MNHEDSSEHSEETAGTTGAVDTFEPVTYHRFDPPVPERPARPKTARAVVIAALVGALTGGAVAYPVARQVVQDETAAVGPVFLDEGGGNAARPAAGTVAAIVEAVRPSIVAISTQRTDIGLFLQPVPQRGAGTGIILDDRGHILTNAHVVDEAEEIEVVLSGREDAFPGKVVGVDVQTDLAVLKIEATGIKPAPVGDSGKLHVGDRVIAVGHALALPGGPTVTLGIVSALDRSIQEPNGVTLEHLIQTDAAINPGNSGGALLNERGEVIGVNTAIAGGAENIGFAISITPAKQIVNQLVKSGEVVRPFLGVRMQDVTKEVAAQQDLSVNEGALVLQVEVDSPADRVGIESGDVIVEVRGKKVTTAGQVSDAVAAADPGDRLEMVIVRGDQRLKVTATLVKRGEGN